MSKKILFQEFTIEVEVEPGTRNAKEKIENYLCTAFADIGIIGFRVVRK